MTFFLWIQSKRSRFWYSHQDLERNQADKITKLTSKWVELWLEADTGQPTKLQPTYENFFDNDNLYFTQGTEISSINSHWNGLTTKNVQSNLQACPVIRSCPLTNLTTFLSIKICMKAEISKFIKTFLQRRHIEIRNKK